MSERPSFETRKEAEAFRRKCERSDPGSSWLAWEAGHGRWTVARTSLPRHEEPSGTATEAKPKPPERDDPRSAPMRNIGPYGGI